MDSGQTLSIIIPTREFEPKLGLLLASLDSQLRHTDLGYEILISAAPQSEATNITSSSDKMKILKCERLGRNHQLNHAAQLSKSEWLLFLHADSKLTDNVIAQVSKILKSTSKKKALYYFWLKFDTDGPFLCQLNSVCANLRSLVFRIPFGDQGLLVRREHLESIGFFPLSYISGEDHALVQVAKKNAFSILPINSTIITSARKYRDLGWINVSMKHLYLTVKQEMHFFNRVSEAKRE